MNEYLELQDENGLIKSLKIENPTQHDDGYLYFDTHDESGELQHYRVKFNDKGNITNKSETKE